MGADEAHHFWVAEGIVVDEFSRAVDAGQVGVDHSHTERCHHVEFCAGLFCCVKSWQSGTVCTAGATDADTDGLDAEDALVGSEGFFIVGFESIDGFAFFVAKPDVRVTVVLDVEKRVVFDLTVKGLEFIWHQIEGSTFAEERCGDFVFAVNLYYLWEEVLHLVGLPGLGVVAEEQELLIWLVAGYVFASEEQWGGRDGGGGSCDEIASVKLSFHCQGLWVHDHSGHLLTNDILPQYFGVIVIKREQR